MGYLGAMPRKCMAGNHEHRNVIYRQYVCISCSGYESGLDLPSAMFPNNPRTRGTMEDRIWWEISPLNATLNSERIVSELDEANGVVSGSEDRLWVLIINVYPPVTILLLISVGPVTLSCPLVFLLFFPDSRYNHHNHHCHHFWPLSRTHVSRLGWR